MNPVVEAVSIDRGAATLLPRGESCVLVIFGASGDLTRRKLIPALYDLACIGCMHPGFDVLGIGRTPMSSEEFRTRVLAIIFSDDVRSESGRVFERQLRARVPDATILYVDARIASGMAPQILQAAAQAQSVIAAVYVIPSAGRTVRINGVSRASVSMDPPLAQLLAAVEEKAADKTMVIALGNPYVASDFPELQNYLCTFSNAPVSEVSAVKALFGEIPIHGHLPVTIPGVAQRGAGIERTAYPAGGSR